MSHLEWNGAERGGPCLPQGKVKVERPNVHNPGGKLQTSQVKRHACGQESCRCAVYPPAPFARQQKVIHKRGINLAV